MVGQLSTGACLEPAVLYLKVVETYGSPDATTEDPFAARLVALALALLAGAARAEDAAAHWQR